MNREAYGRALCWLLFLAYGAFLLTYDKIDFPTAFLCTVAISLFYAATHK